MPVKKLFLLAPLAVLALPAQAFALAVDDSQSAPFQGFVAGAFSATMLPLRSLWANCSAAGNLTLTFPDGSTLVWPVVVGGQTFPGAIKLAISDGTAACSIGQLR